MFGDKKKSRDIIVDHSTYRVLALPAVEKVAKKGADPQKCNLLPYGDEYKVKEATRSDVGSKLTDIADGRYSRAKKKRSQASILPVT